MVLTKSRNLTDNRSFPTFQLFALSICRIAEPIALTSIFPYAYPMARGFVGEDNDNAALYTGILISSFSLSEAITGMFWGGLSDRVGRKPVLLLGSLGTMLSMLMTGFAQTFWFALLARILGGLLNGNIAVIQTMVGELVQNPEHEPRAFAVMPFVWSIGSIVGPAISGLTANSSLSPSRPYLLPNLTCAGILLFGVIVGYFFLEETLHKQEPATFWDKDERQPQVTSALIGCNDNPEAGISTESYGTFNHVQVNQGENWKVNSDGSHRRDSTSDGSKKVFSERVIMLIAGLSIYLYHTMAYDHLLPIFLQDDKFPDASAQDVNPLTVPGGLGLTTKQVGIIMSGNGIIALFIQGVVFPLLTDYFGVWRTFQFVTILHPVVYFIVPYITLLPEDYIFPGVYACLTVRNFFLIPAYPLFLIFIKEAGNTKYLGKINGLAASIGAVARCVSPPVAGILYSQGAHIGFTGLAWLGTGIVAIVGAIQIFWIKRQKNANSTVRLPCARPAENEQREVVHIRVSEVNSGPELEPEP